MKENNLFFLFVCLFCLFVLFITMISLGVSCYTFGTFGKPIMNEGAPNWFHNVSNYDEVIEY